jgi:hypothetical protein
MLGYVPFELVVIISLRAASRFEVLATDIDMDHITPWYLLVLIEEFIDSYGTTQRSYIVSKAFRRCKEYEDVSSYADLFTVEV